MSIPRQLGLGVALLALPFVSSAVAQWPSDPSTNLAIADRLGDQVTPKIAGTSDGGCYISWFDNASGNYDVYLQRLDSQGYEQWPHNGILVSDHPQNSSLVDWALIADSHDNAVVVFSDARAGADLDIYAYKVSPQGEEQWGADGVTLSSNNDFEPQPRVAEATDGDFVFVWPRLPDAGDGRIMMQRLSPEGVERFAPGGIAIVSPTGEDPAFAAVVPSTDGSVIVSWVRDISMYMSPRHIRANRFGTDGSPLWAGPVNVFDAGAIPLGYYPDLQADGNGGALFWWHFTPATIYNAYVQRLDMGGTQLFPHNGVVVSTNATRHHIDPTLSFRRATGEIFVSWNERNSSQSQWGIFAQKFSATGARQWTDGGKELVPVNTIYKSYPRSVPYADGSITFFTDEPTGQYNQDRLVAIRLDGAGSFVWGASPVVLSSVLSGKSRLPATIGNNGVAKIIWEDNRNGNQDVYGQNVNPDGTLGPSSASLGGGGPLALMPSLRNRPNPFSGTTEFVIPAPLAASGASLQIFDGAGRLVRSLPLDGVLSGDHRITWDGRDARGRQAAAGVYLYRLLYDGGGSRSREAILVR